jgi:hypothetical protein
MDDRQDARQCHTWGARWQMGAFGERSWLQRLTLAPQERTLEAAYKKVTLRLIPYLFVCYLFNYLDRVNVGFAKLQMLDDLHMSETVYGLGAGIFFLGYIAFWVPSNLMLYRVGARRWIALIMVLWGILSASLLFVRTPLAFYVLRFLTGVTEAGFFPDSRAQESRRLDLGSHLFLHPERRLRHQLLVAVHYQGQWANRSQIAEHLAEGLSNLPALPAVSHLIAHRRGRFARWRCARSAP